MLTLSGPTVPYLLTVIFASAIFSPILQFWLEITGNPDLYSDSFWNQVSFVVTHGNMPWILCLSWASMMVAFFVYD